MSGERTGGRGGGGGGGRGRRGAAQGRRPRSAPPTEIGEVRIDAIAAGGDGVGRLEQLVVFVPRTAPGDVARVRFARGDRFARGTLADLVAPSPDRVEPPCAHYVRDHCGGCQLQHIGEDAQRAAKRRIVADAIARIGKRAVDVAEVAPSPAPWRYRRKLTLAIRRGASGWIAGLRAYDDPDTVFALQDCPISDLRVVGAWHRILAAAALLPQDARELRGAVRLLDEPGALAADAASETPGQGGSAAVAFTLEGGHTWPDAEAFFEAVPELSAVWWKPIASERRLLLDRRTHHVPGASFVQVNPAVASRLAAHVVERALAYGPLVVVDAYAGAGDSAAALAAHGVRVTAIELDAEASAYAASRLPVGSQAIPARVEDALPEALPADVVIVNPPRTGLDARVCTTLEQALDGRFGAAPRAVLYVSCNPATLARDLARMPSWAVAAAQPYDMFPQTAHVETFVELVPASSAFAASHPAPEPRA